MVAVFDVSSQSTLQSSISDTARIGTCVRPFSSTNGCASGNTTSVLSTFTVTALPVSTVSFFGFAVGAVVSFGSTVAVGSLVGTVVGSAVAVGTVTVGFVVLSVVSVGSTSSTLFQPINSLFEFINS